MKLEEFLKQVEEATEADWDHERGDEKNWPKGDFAGDWGSSQYWSAMRMFDALEKLRMAGKDPIKELGIKVTILQKDDIVNEVLDPAQLKDAEEDEAAQLHGQEYLEEKKIDWFLEKSEEEKQEYIRDEQERAIEHKKFLVDLRARPDRPVVEALDIYRNMSWDLWSAAAKLGNTFFELNEKAKEMRAPGYGPIYNKICQSENYVTGLYCWLLWEHIIKRVGSPEEIFGGFDT